MNSYILYMVLHISLRVQIDLSFYIAIWSRAYSKKNGKQIFLVSIVFDWIEQNKCLGLNVAPLYIIFLFFH